MGIETERVRGLCFFFPFSYSCAVLFLHCSSKAVAIWAYSFFVPHDPPQDKSCIAVDVSSLGPRALFAL